MKRPHGAQPRGLSQQPSSPSFEGTFGRMFRTLPAAHFSNDALEKLAAKMVAPLDDPPTPEDQVDDEENQGIDAGYTYFGQFIDHDLTFDPASSLQKINDPNGLVDYRTPRFDLDNLYGRGPADQPYMYEPDGIHFLLGPELGGNEKDKNARGLPRNNSNPKRAIIGDPRNDENVIVSQLQSNFLRFHNVIADHYLARNPNTTFEHIQKEVRWHYQWVVLHDFLPTIVGHEMVHSILPHLKLGKKIHEVKPDLRIYSWEKDPFIPVEFSVAAYRFGHSMVRPIYRLNLDLERKTIFAKDGNNSLNGFREFPPGWAIDWDLFFNPGNAPSLGKDRTQKSYKIDTSLVNPLGDLRLDAGAISGGPPSLALRNLLRGREFSLPSGQSVAKLIGEEVIDDSKLRVGKANEDGENPDQKTGKIANGLLVDISAEFKGNAPLWYYILAEAQQEFKKNETPIRLGPVGGRIVAEVFIGLLLGDQHSFLSQHPDWKPLKEFGGAAFRIKDLLHLARDGKV
ncbi:heme peroxidase family protein [Mucilaginibacter sp. BT774]|uniref:peroxidase family protein n=1 Tax=Mucilaginibacter sp. BT774 TaxID=3062276 RepID=UPI002674BD7B|nr:heme peroxidase family protein [Mucilaginibacter sp. BT774]MDO3626113.1 heme peroxidase family protein [Mucilaginibacter sp. BT774]